MNSVYHYCFSANEAICRDEKDYIRFINCFALALHSTGSETLADVVMSNHFHCILTSPDIKMFSWKLRYSYTRHFNYKYSRKGKLGERKAYITELKGLAHISTAISYVLRNPTHHGVCSTPFGYKYSSIKTLFSNDFGYNSSNNLSKKDLRKKSVYKWLPKGVVLPGCFKIDSSGVILRECFTSISQTEILYGSVRNFIFQMTRLSGEEWIKEQKEKDGENCGKAITLEDIEKNVFQTSSDKEWLKQLYINEKSRNKTVNIQDIELCKIIDKHISKRFCKKSVYQLTSDEKNLVASYLYNKHHIGNSQQLERCLALKYNI
ncbi:MAG: hypothetical protein IKY70_07475 [Bacteroidales bacterium]|nr:hypothetical protein [Bacteroidales bacterium]